MMAMTRRTRIWTTAGEYACLRGGITYREHSAPIARLRKSLTTVRREVTRVRTTTLSKLQFYTEILKAEITTHSCNDSYRYVRYVGFKRLPLKWQSTKHKDIRKLQVCGLNSENPCFLRGQLMWLLAISAYSSGNLQSYLCMPLKEKILCIQMHFSKCDGRNSLRII